MTAYAAKLCEAFLTSWARLHRSLALDGFESRKTSENKEETPKGVSSLLAEDEGFDGRFAFGANRKEQSASSCRLARLRRSLALDGFESRKTSEKKEETPGGVSSWQRMRDSNPRKRSQSPVCYRYTNPLCGRFAYRVTSNMGIIAPKRKMSRTFFLFRQLFSLTTECPI